jgi:arylsulfatase A-like enzyme
MIRQVPTTGTMPRLLLLVLLTALLRAGEAPPNVVVFLADDAGWGDYAANGNTQVQTPHIDSLAREGVVVERFFVCTVCSPTRAEFLTGRYHQRGGVTGVSTGQERLDLGERTIADALRAAGYATGAFGKWHNGSQWPYHPLARGFQQYVGHTSGHWGEYFDAPLEEDGRMIATSGYIVDYCTTRAVQFIERHAQQPFFCFVPFTTPHSPWAAPAEDWARWRDRPLTQRATDPGAEVVEQTRCALAMVENQDRNVGRVLRRIDELGLRERTIVLYFSDNGPNTHRWNDGMKGKKGGLDEGSLRSPLFIRWSGHLPAGARVTHIAAAIDLAPTLLALTGLARVGDRPFDGRDLSPLLRDQHAAWSERLLFSGWGRAATVRSQRHRLDDRGRLFDLEQDPAQQQPIGEREPEVARRLQQALDAWRKEVMPTAVVPGNAVDPRPIDVGHRQFPITMLPARDGEPRGGIKRSSSAPNCSYFVNWTTREGVVAWSVDVVTAGRYRVTVDYTCPEADAGSRIELAFQDARLAATVAPGWDPPLFTNQDTLPRPAGESTMKPFRTLDLGTVVLPAGRGEMTLRALEIPGRSVMDLRRLTVTLEP